MALKNYYKQIIYLILTRPKKIPSLYRLYTARRRLQNYLTKKNKFSIVYPQTIAIIPTFRCNLHCLQCGQWGQRGYMKIKKDEYGNTQRELTTAQWRLFIDDIARFKPYLYFTGGEPLLRDDIIELIRYASSMNMLASLNTNCTLLSEKASSLVASGLEYLFASIDGPPGINDKIRQGANSSENAINGIRAVQKARADLRNKLPIIEIRMVITEKNQHHLLDMANYVEREIRADSFCILPPIFTTEKLVNATKNIFKEKFGIEATCWDGFIDESYQKLDIQHINEQIENIKTDKWSFKFRMHKPLGLKEFDCQLYFRQPETVIGQNSFCKALYSFPAILPNGDVASCASVPDYIVGNMLNTRFIDIWNGERFKKYRDYVDHTLFPTCSRCSHLYAFS